MNISELTIKLAFLFTPGIIGLLLYLKLTSKRDLTPFKFTVYAFLFGICAYIAFYSVITVFNIDYGRAFKITDQTIAELKAAKLSAANLTVLEKLKNREFDSRKSFIVSLERTIGKKDFDKIKKNILDNSKITRFDLISTIFEKKKFVNTAEILWSCFIAVVLGALAAAADNYSIINTIGQKLRVTWKGAREYGVWGILHEGLIKEPRWVVVRDIPNNTAYMGYVSAASDPDKDKELLLNNVTVLENSSNKIRYEIPTIYLSLKGESIIIEVLESDRGKENDNG